jgi:IS5 family transposase
LRRSTVCSTTRFSSRLYAKHFDPLLGRPSVPTETYLRLMFLKFRYKLGFEPICREVADSISWQRFCRIPLGVRCHTGRRS